MARSFARMATAIWRNHEFLALSGNAQRVYMLLITQPDISASGTLPLTVRRWAALAKDSDTRVIGEGLTELMAANFIAVDRGTEEVVIRSFARWDGGSTNPKRRQVIVKAAREVSSADLRSVLAKEFDRLGLPSEGLFDTASHRQLDSLSDSHTTAGMASLDHAVVEIEFPQEDSLSDSHPDTISPELRVAVGYVSTREPQPSTRNPQPVPAPPAAQGLVAEWLDQCRKRPPKNVIGQMSKQIKAMLTEAIDPDDIRRGIDTWMSKGLHPSTLPSVVNEVMNHTPKLTVVKGHVPFQSADPADYHAEL